jgi:hypothetical protein
MRLLTCFYCKTSYELPANKAIADARSVYVDTVSIATLLTFDLFCSPLQLSASKPVYAPFDKSFCSSVLHFAVLAYWY